MALLSLAQRPEIKFNLPRDFYERTEIVEHPKGLHALPLMEVFYIASEYSGRVYLSKKNETGKILVLTAKDMTWLLMGVFVSGTRVTTYVEKIPSLNYKSTAEKIAQIVRTGSVD